MSKTPTVKQIHWLYVAFQVAVMLLLAYAFKLNGSTNPLLAAAVVFFVLTMALRTFIASPHRYGMRLARRQNFSQALLAFEKSVAFFEKHSWVDEFRFITLLSSSKMSYLEMDLCNIAFCHSQLGNHLKAKEYYQKAFDRFPQSGLAKAGLAMLSYEKADSNTAKKTAFHKKKK